MAKKDRHVSETPATAWLKARDVAFTEHPYDYVDHGGTAESARQLGVAEHAVIKTLVMHDDKLQPLLVLMHGDREVSTKTLARALGDEEPVDGFSSEMGWMPLSPYGIAMCQGRGVNSHTTRRTAR